MDNWMPPKLINVVHRGKAYFSQDLIELVCLTICMLKV